MREIINHNLQCNFNNIKININTTNLTIKKSDSNETKITYYNDLKNPLSIKTEDNTLVIGKGKRKWFTFLYPCFKKNILTISLPNIPLNILDIKSNTGKIDISSLSEKLQIFIKLNTGSLSLNNICCRNLDIKNNTGNIILNNVIVENDLHIKSNTGSIKIDQSDAEEISIKSNTGNICGNLLSKRAFVVRCKTGKVTLPDAFGNKKCEITTNTGNISFK